MSELGTCIASTAHIPTLRARCALHSHRIPFTPVLTCAEQGKGAPEPPTNTALTTLTFNKATNTNAMHACEMTLEYLRGGLSTCSAVWAEFEYFSLKFINIPMQLCKNFLSNFINYASHLLYQKPFLLAQPCF